MKQKSTLIKASLLTAGAVSALGTISTLTQCSTRTGKEGSKPNIILILIDDMGWKDAGYAGSTYYQTPNIDQLAKEGIVFTNAYSSSPISSPSRGALFTGMNPAATQFTCVFGPETEVPGGDGLFPISRKADSGTNQYNEALNRHALPRNTKLLVQNLRDDGYHTALFGKWHCGVGEGFFPEDRGFETAIGYRPKHIPTKGHYVKSFEGNLAALENYGDERYISEVLTEECVRFINENKDKPFMAVLSHYLVHTPLQGLPEKVEKYNNLPGDDQNNPIYAAMVESVDESVGAIMQALKDNGIEDKTMVVFTSDNGGYTPVSTSNYPVFGGKSHPFEGGVKIPLIIKYPGTSSESVCKERVIGMDIFPTFLDYAGVSISPEQKIDGTSIMPLLQGGHLESRPLIFHFPHYTHATSPYSAIIYEDWKLIRFYNDEEGAYLLYHLSEDPYEQHDLSQQESGKVTELQEILTEHLQRMGAQMPPVNPNYVKGAPNNQNRKTTLEIATQERQLFEQRRGDTR